MHRRMLLPGVSAAATSLVLLLTTLSRGHELWLEPIAGHSRLHFGEFAANLSEASPGYLDRLVGPSAWLRSAAGKEALVATKLRDAFEIDREVRPGESLVVVEPAYPLLGGQNPGGKRTHWTPAARFVLDCVHQVPPELTLDVVPAGAPGALQVLFRGRPLAEVEVKLTAQTGWAVTETTDASGIVRFSLPWQGLYLAGVRHRVAEPGQRRLVSGAVEHFDEQSYSTTLAFTSAAGFPSPPRPPAAPPNALSAQ